MKVKSYIISSLLILIGILFQFCDETEKIDLTKSPPAIGFAFDTLYVDLNNVDNPPIVAFIKSEIGLKEVGLHIKTTDGAIIEYALFSDFFNKYAYSLSEIVTYDSSFEAIIVEAVDIADRKTSEELSISVTDFVNPPIITFSVDKLVYDEFLGGQIPNTEYSITSEAGLKKLEMFFATEDGQIPYIEAIELEDNPSSYEFDEPVEYSKEMLGFIVKVTDLYNKVTISTLPFEYIEIPTPVVALVTEKIDAEEAGSYEIQFDVKAVGGIRSIEILRWQNNGISSSEESLKTIPYGEEIDEVTVTETVEVTEATSSVIIRVTNTIGKVTVETIPAYVNMQYVPELYLGGHRYNIGLNVMPGVYPLLSFKDMKTYSMDYYTENKDNTANIDMKLYIHYGTAPPAIYFPSSMWPTGTYSGQFADSFGLTIENMDPEAVISNDTRLANLGSDYDFENATSASIKAIPLSTISTRQLAITEPGFVIAFKTASTSTSGGNRVGIIKEVARIPVTPPAGYGAYAPSFSISVLAIKFPNP